MAFDLKDRLKLSGTQFNILISVSLILVIYLIGYQGIYKMRTRETSQLEIDAVEFKGKLAVIRSLEEEEKKVAEGEARLGGFREASDLVQLVNRLAAELGITVNGIEPQAVRDETFVEIQPVSIDLVCTYHSLGTLLSRIESQGPHIRIESVDLRALESAGLTRSYGGYGRDAQPWMESVPGGDDAFSPRGTVHVVLAGIRPKK
ncbi:MAG: type 4a pilus biogenesis protein PilO [Candidatus Omnitrophica bacterium]|nr:type 4a pilus biogenesis protein PilO [Candidatus Omnitrophota bacterium]